MDLEQELQNIVLAAKSAHYLRKEAGCIRLSERGTETSSLGSSMRKVANDLRSHGSVVPLQAGAQGLDKLASRHSSLALKGLRRFQAALYNGGN